MTAWRYTHEHGHAAAFEQSRHARGANVFLESFGLGHQVEDAVLAVSDFLLAEFDLVLESAVDLVGLGLEHLVLQLGDLLLLDLNLAFELGPRLAIVQCPRLTDDVESPRAKLMREALLDLGRHGDRCGSSLALEIGDNSHGADTGRSARRARASLDSVVRDRYLQETAEMSFRE